MNSDSEGGWEKLVRGDSFAELKMQFQRFNPEGRYFTFGALLGANPEAEQLHFLVGGSVLGYLEQLRGMIPDVADNLGHRFMRIADCRFEIIRSDIRDIATHEVAFNFYSTPLLWHGTAGSLLIVSDPRTDDNHDQQDAFDTYSFELRRHVSIDKLRELR